MKINLGSGSDYRYSWVNVDYANIKKDVNHDLSKFPYPFKSNIAEIIECNAVLEHLTIKDQIKLIEECYRILKKDGKLIIRVPHFTSIQAYNCIEHVKGYSYRTMESFLKKPYQHSQEDYITKTKFSKMKVKLIFGKKYQIWNYIIEYYANIFPDVYEQSFLRLFPAEGVHYEMIK